MTVFASPLKNFDKEGAGAPHTALDISYQEHLLYQTSCNFFSESVTVLVLMNVRKLLGLFTVVYQ